MDRAKVIDFLDDQTRVYEHIETRKAKAAENDKKLANIVAALKHEGYSGDQINKIFVDEMTPELANELAAIGNDLNSGEKNV